MTSKLERLMNLVAALLNTTRPVTAEELRQRVEGYADNDASFRRTFERDKEDLRQMGIPIVVDEVPGVDPPVLGYRIDRAQYLGTDPKLAADELAALHVAASLVQIGGPTDTAMWKIGGVVDSGAAPAGEPLVALPADANLAPLFQAATELRVATFTYRERERAVEPLRLMFQRGHWYLAAFDRSRNEERQFRLDRIEGAVEVGTPNAFVRRRAENAGLHVQSWELGDNEPITAHLLVDADHVMFATHQLGRERIVETRADGAAVFALSVRNQGAFRSFALSFLDHAEVLDPPELRELVVSWLRDVVAAAS